jgi:hypothetical protein
MPNRTEAMRRKPTPKPPGDYRSLRLFSTLLAIPLINWIYGGINLVNL